MEDEFRSALEEIIDYYEKHEQYDKEEDVAFTMAQIANRALRENNNE
jgi:Asp-tRNA(Asn)/Glu-tRNA(Gln) amidotransferase C subunit